MHAWPRGPTCRAAERGLDGGRQTEDARLAATMSRQVPENVVEGGDVLGIPPEALVAGSFDEVLAALGYIAPLAGARPGV
jgi:hypothetical protein